jgi:hypothetical protein
MPAEHDHPPTATEATTLTEVLDGYSAAGYDGSFTVVAVAAGEAPMASLRRLEGASDPDDMLAVVALTCPRCGNQGTVVLGFGPSATSEDGDVLAAFRDDREFGGLPADSAPDEAPRAAGPQPA